MPESTLKKRWRARCIVSIRVLMLLILAIAGVLGWKVRRAERQKLAVSQIDRSIAKLWYDYEYANGGPNALGVPWAPKALRTTFGEEYFREVAAVEFHSGSFFDMIGFAPGKKGFPRPMTDADIVPIEQFDRLQSLSIQSEDITDAGLTPVAPLTQLVELRIREARITDAGLVHLRGLSRLRKLELEQILGRPMRHASPEDDAFEAKLRANGVSRRECERQVGLRYHNKYVTSAGLAHLADLRRMEELTLHASGVTDEGLIHLKSMRRLQNVDLSRTGITGAGLMHLKGMNHLRELRLNYTCLNDAGMAHLAGMTALCELQLDGTEITDAGLTHLRGLDRLQVLTVQYGHPPFGAGLAALEGLKRLRVLRVSWVTDEGLRHLAGLPNLDTLNLERAFVTDAGLSHLSRLDSLKSLDLSYSHQLTDAGLRHLSRLSALEYLNLSSTKIQGPGLAHLHGLPRLHRLDLDSTYVTHEAVEALRNAIPGIAVNVSEPAPFFGPIADQESAEGHTPSSEDAVTGPANAKKTIAKRQIRG